MQVHTYARISITTYSSFAAVIFYSNDILSRVVPPAAASYISLGIALLNAIMTFPAIFLIQHLGRRSLLV